MCVVEDARREEQMDTMDQRSEELLKSLTLVSLSSKKQTLDAIYFLEMHLVQSLDF